MNLSEFSDKDFEDYKMKEWPTLMRAQASLEEPVDERYTVDMQTAEAQRDGTWDEDDYYDTSSRPGEEIYIPDHMGEDA
jgi:hypothetical protein